MIIWLCNEKILLNQAKITGPTCITFREDQKEIYLPIGLKKYKKLFNSS